MNHNTNHCNWEESRENKTVIQNSKQLLVLNRCGSDLELFHWTCSQKYTQRSSLHAFSLSDSHSGTDLPKSTSCRFANVSVPKKKSQFFSIFKSFISCNQTLTSTFVFLCSAYSSKERGREKSVRLNIGTFDTILGLHVCWPSINDLPFPGVFIPKYNFVVTKYTSDALKQGIFSHYSLCFASSNQCSLFLFWTNGFYLFSLSWKMHERSWKPALNCWRLTVYRLLCFFQCYRSSLKKLLTIFHWLNQRSCICFFQ